MQQECTKSSKLTYSPEDFIEPSQNKTHTSSARTQTETSPLGIANQLLNMDISAHEREVVESASDHNNDHFLSAFRSNCLLEQKDGDPIDGKLAELVSELFISKPDESSVAEKLKTVKRPENCKELKTPEVNKLIWDMIPPETRSMDCRVQKVQTGIMKATIVVVKTLDTLLQNRKALPEETYTELTNSLSDDLTMTACQPRDSYAWERIN